MNLSAFVAQRVAFQRKNSFSALIIRIAIAAVALSVAIMICATALAAGFKQTISEKIFGFWGHVHITNYDSNNSFESVPISVRQPFYPYLDTLGRVDYVATHHVFNYEWRTHERTQGGVRRVQMFANKAGIIKTKNQLEGIVLKGIGADYDWHFLQQFLVAGDTLALPNWRFVPDYLAGKHPVVEPVAADSTRTRFADVVPTPATSLAQAHQKATTDSVYAALADTAISNQIIISESTSRRLNVHLNDKFTVHFVEGENQRVRKFVITGIYKTGLEEYDRKFALVDIRQIQQLNNWRPYQISGFEVFLDNIADIDPMGQYIYYQQTTSDLYAQTIKDRYPNIFGWLKLQDLNEQFILALMLIVSVINMTTALMILILERTNMIGTLKALGSTNWAIQKMFLYYAAIIVGRGLLWGNGIGIGLCLAQKYGHFIHLDEEAYYVSVAPISLHFTTILLLNIGTLCITLLVLLIPSMLVTRITPVKAIRFK